MEYRRKLRDLGAAASFGLSSTAEKKDAERKHAKRVQQHHELVASCKEIDDQRQTIEKTMDAHFAAAQRVLLSTGALVPDADGNITYGWYRPQEGAEDNPDYHRSAVGSIPAFGLGIGTPAAIWTVVGIYGTAATGTAIGTLSGAAAGAATAAWIGRAATLGLGGMTAGRLALGPIGIVASLLTLPIGAAIAGNNERNYKKRVAETEQKIDRLEKIVEKCRAETAPLLPRMAVVTADMQRRTSQLETATAGTPEARNATSKLRQDMENSTAIKNEISKIYAECNQSLKDAGFVNED